MAVNDVNYVSRAYPEHQVFCAMPHPPPHIWVHPHDRSLQPLYLSTFYTNGMSFITKIESNIWLPPTSLAAVFHIQVRPKCGPLAHTSSSSAWGTWTSTVSTPDTGMVTVGTSSGIYSMGNLGERGAEPLEVLGGESADSSCKDN